MNANETVALSFDVDALKKSMRYAFANDLTVVQERHALSLVQYSCQITREEHLVRAVTDHDAPGISDARRHDSSGLTGIHHGDRMCALNAADRVA